MSSRAIKVLVVDDSVLFRQTLIRNLGQVKGIEVVGYAVDAKDAMGKIDTLQPDVVTLDVEMPGMNGIDFLKQLIPRKPIPVVVVTSLPLTAFNALDAGAVDFVPKPSGRSGTDTQAFFLELSSKIKIASIARLGARRAAPQAQARTPAPRIQLPHLKQIDDDIVIAIGASTGGTEAILQVVKDLPATTPGILVVQHMPPVFTKMYAERLNKTCIMSVKECENGDRVERGRILIAAGEYHMTLHTDARGHYVKSLQGDKVSGHCPSVDVLFNSVADAAGKRSVGIILTGMGSDGAKGLLKMSKSGAYTIGQDKESSVVYGMPMVAFNIGGVKKQLPIDRISTELINYLDTLAKN